MTGFLHPLDALDDMAASAITALQDPERHRQIAEAARRRVHEQFCAERVVPMYEACYREVIDRQ